MARTYYGYEKRQKELAKQNMKEDKRLRKVELRQQRDNPEPESPGSETESES
ncbi:MAG: hypothetical protein ACE5DY_06800 [Mariprofundaceae bacterium]